MSRHRVSEDDYPTGPINVVIPADDEFWDDQPRDELGRWAPKEKRLAYRNIVGDETPEVAPRIEARTVAYEQVPVSTVSICYERNNHTGIKSEVLIDGSTRLTRNDGFVSIVLRGKRSVEGVLYPGDPGYADRVNLSVAETVTRTLPGSSATPADIRQWAREVGLTVSDRGRIPLEIIDQYMREN